MTQSPFGKEEILNILAAIRAPLKEGLASYLSGIHIQDSQLTVSFDIPLGQSKEYESLIPVIEKTLEERLPLTKARVVFTSPPSQKPSSPPPAIPALAQVAHRIAIASGKGGVGKSTVTVNLALTLSAMGLAVGLLDADIYGPSIPHLLGLQGKKPSFEGSLIQPLERHGIKCMSIGMLVKEEGPLVWRGPMVGRAIQQLLETVEWGVLDVLLIDMPPGTGDAHLTLAQKAGLTGAIIVSTPQDLALTDARKGLETFRKTGVPLVGIIENMSFFVCHHCGERTDIFSHGGARREAAKLKVPFLGEIPLNADIRAAADSGEPLCRRTGMLTEAQAFTTIAQALTEYMGVR